MDGYVSKPIHPQTLAQEIETVMRRLSNRPNQAILSC